MIHPSAIIYDNVTIEEDVYIGAYCIIGAPPEWKGREHESKGVIIKKGARLTGFVSVDAGAERTTIIGENAYIMKHSYIAHDCIIENNVTLSAGVKIAGYCIIQEGANLGMGVAVHQKCRVPSNVMIGMNSVVTKKSLLLSNQKYAGAPVKNIGTNERPKNNN
jgi:UDP-N-acetylglucosamine acyltransferase